MYARGVAFGAWDLFHEGHVRLLAKARAQCAHLTVAVSTDEYIATRKGRLPVRPLSARMEIVAACRYVDRVAVQSPERDKAQVVAETGADVIFVGDDWTPETFGGEGLGVPVVYLPYTPGVSSTALREVAV